MRRNPAPSRGGIPIEPRDCWVWPRPSTARAALSSLRAGGNRSGAEVALTWLTGYPMAVTYRSGAPEYRPGSRGVAAAAGEAGAILVVGAAAALSDVFWGAAGRN